MLGKINDSGYRQNDVLGIEKWKRPDHYYSKHYYSKMSVGSMVMNFLTDTIFETYISVVHFQNIMNFVMGLRSENSRNVVLFKFNFGPL